MRVVQIIDLLTVGGAQKQLILLAAYAPAYNIDLKVITLGDYKQQPLEADLIKMNVEIIRFPSATLFSFSRIISLIQYLRNGKFDLVHTHLTYSNIVGVLAAKIAGLPVVSSLHSTNYLQKKNNHLRQMIETWTLRNLSSCIIAVGYKVEEAHRSRFINRNIDILTNGVSKPQALSEIDRKKIRNHVLHGLDDDLIIISAGRFSEPKAYHILVEAFLQVHLELPNTKLVVVGDGPLFENIKDQIVTLELSDFAYLLGERHDVSDLFLSSDLYVSSSIWEGLPLATLEAMMAGLPVVVTNVGDLPRVVIEGTGLVVPPDNVDELAKAIIAILRNESVHVRVGRAARKLAEDQFSAEKWMDGLFQIYQKALR